MQENLESYSNQLHSSQVFFGILAYQLSQYCSWSLGILNEIEIKFPKLISLISNTEPLDIVNIFFLLSVVFAGLCALFPKCLGFQVVFSVILGLCVYFDSLWRGLWNGLFFVLVVSVGLWMIPLLFQKKKCRQSDKLFFIECSLFLYFIVESIYTVRNKFDIEVLLFEMSLVIVLAISFFHLFFKKRDHFKITILFLMIVTAKIIFRGKYDPAIFCMLVYCWYEAVLSNQIEIGLVRLFKKRGMGESNR